MKSILHKFAAIIQSFKARVFLNSQVVTQVLAAKIEEVNAGLGKIACQQDTLDGLDFGGQELDDYAQNALELPGHTPKD
ncbi:MAG: hypothetical protein ACYTEW_20710 [Planctomycetota bacterium]